MVAHQGHDAAVRAASLALQPHQVLDDPQPVRPAVDHVAGLHEHGLASGPATSAIRQASRLSDGAPGGEVAMQVAHGDDAVNGRGGLRRR